MDKEQIINLIAGYVREGRINKADLFTAYDIGVGKGGSTYMNEARDVSPSNKWSISTVLYFLGGGIVFLGIAIMIGTNWNDISDLGKILVTLGVATLSYIGATVVEYGESVTPSKNHKRMIGVASSLHLLGALLFPLGAYVTLDVAGIDTNRVFIAFVIWASLFALYLFTLFMWRRGVVALSTIFYGSLTYISGINLLLLESRNIFNNIGEYAYLSLGISFIFLGRYMSTSSIHRLSGLIYSVGSIFILASALVLGGFGDSNIYWDIAYVPILALMIWLSSYLRSSAILTFSSISLIVYISKITAEYFRDSISWPLALVMIGFVIIGVAYGAVRFGKIYVR